MKNKMTDLNNHLFASLERLNDEGLSEEEIRMECERSKALVEVSSQIIKTTETTIKAAELYYNSGLLIPQVVDSITQKRIT